MDTYSNFGFAKIFTAKTALSAIDFLEIRVFPVYGQFNIPFDRILIDNGKEYTTHWANAHHMYETFLKKNRIKHTKIKPGTPQGNGIVEKFNHYFILHTSFLQ